VADNDQTPRPGISTPVVLTTVAIGAALSVLSWLLEFELALEITTLTVLYALTMAIVNPLAYRAARKQGSWPPSDRRRS
jgi:membrane protein implicated in regulation of membrane protease activity